MLTQRKPSRCTPASNSTSGTTKPWPFPGGSLGQLLRSFCQSAQELGRLGGPPASHLCRQNDQTGSTFCALGEFWVCRFLPAPGRLQSCPVVVCRSWSGREGWTVRDHPSIVECVELNKGPDRGSTRWLQHVLRPLCTLVQRRTPNLSSPTPPPSSMLRDGGQTCPVGGHIGNCGT